MELLFVAQRNDNMGVLALEKLQALGYQTKLLFEGQQSPSDSIALFTPANLTDLGARRRFLRYSVDKIRKVTQVPSWITTRYFAAVLKTKHRRGRRFQFTESDGFVASLRNLAESYACWEPTSCHYIWSKPRKNRWIEALKKYRTVKINDWSVNLSADIRVFPDWAVAESIELLQRWQKSFAMENTWSRRELGTPSLVVRLDCVIHDETLTVYEVEERPAGMGVSSIANPFFEDRLENMLRVWPDFEIVISDQRRGTDDSIWVESLKPRNRIGSDLVLVRAEPEETEFHHLEPRSVSSLIAKGDKSYGQDLGLWRQVQSVSQLDWDNGFVLKPRQGSKLRDVEIWDPQHRPGSSIRAKVESALAKNESMFAQPLVVPMLSGNDQFQWMIYRVFFGYNPVSGCWECLGGNWNARSNLRIHGASDALFGPVVLA